MCDLKFEGGLEYRALRVKVKGPGSEVRGRFCVIWIRDLIERIAPLTFS